MDYYDWSLDENFDESSDSNYSPSNKILKIIKSHFSDQLKGKSLLEVGFWKNNLMELCSRSGMQVSGLDINQRAVWNKIGLMDFEGLDYESISCSSFQSYAFDRKFDVITCMSVFQFADSVGEVLDFIVKMKENTNIEGVNIISIGVSSKFKLRITTSDLDIYLKDPNWEVDYKVRKNFLNLSERLMITAKKLR